MSDIRDEHLASEWTVFEPKTRLNKLKYILHTATGILSEQHAIIFIAVSCE